MLTTGILFPWVGLLEASTHSTTNRHSPNRPFFFFPQRTRLITPKEFFKRVEILELMQKTYVLASFWGVEMFFNLASY